MAKVKKASNTEEVQATIKQLLRQTLREALETELEEFLGYKKYERSDTGNCRNGYSSKTIKTSSGSLEIKVPQDRKAEFEPQIIKKHQTTLNYAG